VLHHVAHEAALADWKPQRVINDNAPKFRGPLTHAATKLRVKRRRIRVVRLPATDTPNACSECRSPTDLAGTPASLSSSC
jgi:hypothetical protein